MKQHKEILAQIAVEKSETALRDACNNIDISLFVAQNRAYYAIFYIVSALAYLDGFTTSKHKQLMGWFNKKYIHEEKVFDSSLTKIYSTLMINREKSDYDVTENPTKEQVLKGIESARIFIEIVKTYILEKLREN